MWEWVQVPDPHVHSPTRNQSILKKNKYQVHAKQIVYSKTVNYLKMLASEEKSVMALVVS